MNIDQNAILATWLRTALSQFKPLDRKFLNGGAEDQATIQLLSALEDAFQRAGQQGVERVWGALKTDYPAIQEQLQKRRRLYRGDQLSQLQPLSFLIQDRLVVGGLHCIYGDSNVGKSFWALEAAERVAAMGKIAIYIMGEGANGYVGRHAIWKKVRGIDTDEHIFFWNGAFPLTDPAARQEFAQELLLAGLWLPEIEPTQDLKEGLRRPDLIVIDTLASTFVGDENNVADMTAYLNSTLNWRLEGTAILLVHHSNRADTGPRGSSAFKAGLDVLFFMRDEDGEKVIECEKFKDHALVPPVRRRLVPHTDGSISAATLEIMPSGKSGNPLSAAQQRILQILSSHSYDQGARASDIRSITGMSAQQFHSAIEHLLESGLILKDGKYDPFVLSERGRSAAKSLGIQPSEPPIEAYLPEPIDIEF